MCIVIGSEQVEFSHPAKRRIAALRAQLDNETETLLHVVEERDALTAEVAALRARLAGTWQPVANSLEYDLITHAIKTGELPDGYVICTQPAPVQP